jgi:hypothetical protein
MKANQERLSSRKLMTPMIETENPSPKAEVEGSPMQGLFYFSNMNTRVRTLRRSLTM